MTDDELTAAAGRVREGRRLEAAGHRRDQADAIVYGDRRQSRAADVTALADAFLDAHPADSSEPVTVEWLRSVGATDKVDSRESGVAVYGLYLGPAKWFDFAGGGELLIDHGPGQPAGWPIKTRGHVRRLAAALGVPLTGGR